MFSFTEDNNLAVNKITIIKLILIHKVNFEIYEGMKLFFS